MITREQIQARLRECGYVPASPDREANVIAAALRGDTVIVIEQGTKPTYVGAYDRTIVRPLAESFPGAVYE